MRIRNRKSYLTSMPEGTVPANPAKNMTSRLYFLVLIAIAAYLLYVLANKFLYVESRGQVEVGRYLIHATTTGAVDTLLVKHGEQVSSGQPLLTLMLPPSAPQRQNTELFKASRDLELKKNEIAALESAAISLREATPRATVLPTSILKLDNDLRMKRVELSLLRDTLHQQDALASRHGQAQRTRLLELGLQDPATSSLVDLERQRLAAKIGSSEQELAALIRYRQELLQAEQQALQIKIATIKGEVGPLSTYLESLRKGEASGGVLATQVIAPLNGEVQAIFKVVGEQASPGEPLLALRTATATATVHGYFDEKYLSLLKSQKNVKILFPDGSKGRGVFANHYSIASSYPEKLKNQYIPIKSAVLVEIVPADPDDAQRWRSFDRMDVTIRVRR